MRALACGFFPVSLKSVGVKSNVPEIWQGNAFRAGSPMEGKIWRPVFKESGVFDITEMSLSGPAQDATVYLSFWINSPYSLENLLLEPNLPRVDLRVAASGSVQVWLNEQQILRDRDTGSMAIAKALKLGAGWNHFLVKLMRTSARWDFEASFMASQPAFLSQLDSALERP